jgi:hypothetical protein
LYKSYVYAVNIVIGAITNALEKCNFLKFGRDGEVLEAASTSETSVNLNQTTRRNNPEDNHIHTKQLERVLLKYLLTVTRKLR